MNQQSPPPAGWGAQPSPFMQGQPPAGAPPAGPPPQPQYQQPFPQAQPQQSFPAQQPFPTQQQAIPTQPNWGAPPVQTMQSGNPFGQQAAPTTETGRWPASNPPQAAMPSQPPVQQQAPQQPVAPNGQMALPFPEAAPQQPQQQQVSQPPVQVQQASAAAADVSNRKTIQQLLRDFAKQPGCERYTADSDKIKLLEDYLWIRQLTPNLPFEVFLQLYSRVADFDDVNLKHPADAIKQRLPRTKKVAEELKCHQWAAKEVVDFVALYVDMIREAEATSAPIPMEFVQFLVSPVMVEGFLAGNFKEEAAPAQRGGGSKGGQKKPEVQRPSGPQQRAIHTQSSGRQFRGYTTAFWQDPQSQHYFADFRSDEGEEFKGVGLATLESCADAAPNQPQTPEGQPLPELGTGKLTIPKANYPSVVQALALTVPMGTVAMGDVIYSFNHQFQTGHVALIEVVNGESGPFVDARLCITSPDNVVAEINAPRKNIDGLYTFEAQDGVFNLEVVGNQ